MDGQSIEDFEAKWPRGLTNAPISSTAPSRRSDSGSAHDPRLAFTEGFSLLHKEMDDHQVPTADDAQPILLSNTGPAEEAIILGPDDLTDIRPRGAARWIRRYRRKR
ncbi:hypothetical protein ACFWPQ_49240 [Streptomyces sp. NPDC058464]|uniref:hypothetical protein n=1 Tax=Streptomyces sp. NPDC058464 TaxID=3346511 RepID=UPI003652084C